LNSFSGYVSMGEEMANEPGDAPLNPDQLAALRQRFARMSLTGLTDAYYAAWLRCKMEPGGKPPRAAFIQELVQAWKELRKAG
jgi:hypothetical protein